MLYIEPWDTQLCYWDHIPNRFLITVTCKLNHFAINLFLYEDR